MHRDIKPENLIFDEKGYLHVTDFGIAKYSTNNNSNETSGTPGYMAPEVINGQNHTGSVDYFAVGIITYELMMGKRPYLGKNRKEIREQMMIKQIVLDKDNIPLGWSVVAADFINRLLLRKDSSRLGYYNEFEVKSHPWLKNINFDDLINYKIQSPFIPRKNHDNYDKRYCREIEQIGINTNLRYEEYRNDERYCDLFEGFTYYNIDESKLILHDEINRAKIKIIKNVNSNINDNNYIKKSRTINIENEYKNKSNKNLLQKKDNNISQIKNRNLSPPRRNNILSPRGNDILSPKRNNNLSPIIKKNTSSYNNRSNYKNKTINYSNGNDSSNRKTPLIPKLDLKHNKSCNILINDNSKISLKNEKEIYIMASPRNRGRISIYSNDNNIDNSFRRCANHSFVETNYSKGKILRRSYSSSNIHNSNYVNIFNLLVNNVNNNIINNNENINGKYLFNNYSKLSTPISYNKINSGTIPIDKTPISNYKNYNNNYSSNNKSCHYHNKSFIEKPKNYSFYCGDNKNNLLNYNYNNFNNYNFYNSNTNSNPYRYINKDLKNIFDDSLQEQNKNNIIKIYNNNNNIKRNHSNYSLRQKIPTGSIKKIIPISLKDNSILNKSNISNITNIDYSNKKTNIMNHNKIRSIEPINITKISNNFLYIDKYVNNSSNKEENKNKNNEKLKEINNIYNYKTIDCNSKVNNIIYNNNFLFEKNINKRNRVRHKNSYCHVNINSMNNNFYYNSNTKTNITINNPNNEINKKEKNISYKKIPKPIPSDKKTSTKKKIEINKKVPNKNYSNPQINIINNNIINNNIINNNFINGSPMNYNNNKCNYNNNSNNSTNTFKENIKNNINNKYKSIIEINNNKNNNNNKKEISFNNNQYGINNTKFFNRNEKKDIISMKINEKTFCQYKYLENFDKYKKIKNNNNRNRHNCINKENSNIDSNNNIIKKKIREKYLTYDERDNKTNKHK